MAKKRHNVLYITVMVAAAVVVFVVGATILALTSGPIIDGDPELIDCAEATSPEAPHGVCADLGAEPGTMMLKEDAEWLLDALVRLDECDEYKEQHGFYHDDCVELGRDGKRKLNDIKRNLSDYNPV